MKRKNNPAVSLWPAVMIFILILVFSALILREGHLRETDIARFEAFKTLNSIAEQLREGKYPENLPRAVKGWGVYLSDGSMEKSYGNVPEKLHISYPIHAGGLETIENGVLRIIIISNITPFEPEEKMEMSNRQSKGRELKGFFNQGGGRFSNKAYLLIDWDIRENTQNNLWKATGVAGLSLLAALLLVMQVNSAGKLAKIKTEQEKHKRLVQLGMAARTLTHEIRNPLGVLKAQQSLLKKMLNDEYKENLDIIDEEINRINLLTEKVREWLKDPRGNPVYFDVSAELKKITDRLPWQITVNTDLSGTQVYMDKELFNTAISNLIRNAEESLNDSGEKRPIEISIRKSAGKNVRIIIADRGKGLPAGKTEELFDPFFTTKTSGSGVGLALSKQIIEAAGGKLTLRNRRKGGAEAEIELPKYS